MKLHFFCSGSIIAWEHLIFRGGSDARRIEVPVPFFLLEHPGGLFLFDTGQQISQYVYPPDAAFIPVVSPEDTAVELLKAQGVMPGDIRGIILSHHHSDHTGGIADFPHTPCYIRKEETVYPACAEMVKDASRKWHFPDGVFDLCGDGKILLLPTPGHTAGHQSLLLCLDDGEKLLLTADAAYTPCALEKIYPEDNAAFRETICRFREYASAGVRIITGHDPDTCCTLRAEFPPERAYSSGRAEIS
ncbi:MAG: N-acyl homoserine lactonase family protein [Lentisphaeria bacterium]|nr:N-acyl homoserine lactonase family protein [Lentisphaeria bacterium]